MKKTLLTWSLAFLALYTPQLFAEWEPVAISSEGEITYYIDREAIRKVGGFVYFWVIVDYLEPRNGNLSTKDYYKAICATRMTSLQSVQSFNVPMAKGEPARVSVYERETDAWIENDYGTIGGILVDEACK